MLDLPPAPTLEAQLINEHMADLHRHYPAEAAMIQDLMDTIDYSKTVIRGELRVRGMLLALGSGLVRRAESSLPRMQGWLAQFAKDGALTDHQARQFSRQARALYL